MNLILASGSPRRAEILQNAGYVFEAAPTLADETVPAGTFPQEAVQLLAQRKAQAGRDLFPNDVVLAADTLVALGLQALGKPEDEAQAREMLRSLSNRTHRVYTGVCIASPLGTRAFVCETAVTFLRLTDFAIDHYVKTGEPMDKAGAYGIQGRGCLLVKEIKGDYFNVVGLPIAQTAKLLEDFSIFPA